MRWALAITSVAIAAAILADQHRSKASHGEDGWWDWHSRDSGDVSMARDTIWSHDAMAFVFAVEVPLAIAVSAAVFR